MIDKKEYVYNPKLFRRNVQRFQKRAGREGIFFAGVMAGMVMSGIAVFLFPHETLELVVFVIRFRQYGSLTWPLS
ncbi:hypothetical protein SDD15_004497 [Salmonella enterica]|uniref:hypothetical protein n=1 Tax=Citrobacter freundii TaxID=546 RepID=UPI002097D442|nr:hypothetical protein [Citrobacter freundii]ELU8076024.1 hypothetical protein [Salmonella enterica]MEB6855235.1 hypothetical protein [Escherichia coli]URZ94066.1 hypothetical protein [Citrobacter freundii]